MEDKLDGRSSRSRSSTVITLLASLSLPASSTAVTKYSRWGTPLSWKVFEVVSPRRPNEPELEPREYTR